MEQMLHDFIPFFKSEYIYIYICHIFNSIIPINSIIHSIINKLFCSELVKSEKIARSIYFLVIISLISNLRTKIRDNC